MTLPSVASLALPRPKLPKAVPGLAASPPPEGWLVLYHNPYCAAMSLAPCVRASVHSRYLGGSRDDRGVLHHQPCPRLRHFVVRSSHRAARAI